MKVTTRKRLGLALFSLSVLAMSWGLGQQLPYAIVEPGPAYNVLGENEGVEVIQVSGVPSSENPGSLDLLTISVWGEPGNTPILMDLIQPFFANDRKIVPIEAFYPVGQTTEEADALNATYFEESQTAVIAAAKAALPKDVAEAIQVKLSLAEVGGPSGGLMFTLGIIEKATSGSLTGGKKIAGTGTISADGSVGAIGGIDFKMISAKRSGDQYFLAPRENCDEVIGNIPSGLNVFAVSNLNEALKVLKVISADGDISKLPVCSAK